MGYNREFLKVFDRILILESLNDLREKMYSISQYVWEMLDLKEVGYFDIAVLFRDFNTLIFSSVVCEGR